MGVLTMVLYTEWFILQGRNVGQIIYKLSWLVSWLDHLENNAQKAKPDLE